MHVKLHEPKQLNNQTPEVSVQTPGQQGLVKVEQLIR